MSWWQAVVLGAVQGLTEFLPVSSSGHLVVAEAAIGLETPGVMVEVALHVATLLAVVAVYWRRLRELVRGAAARDGGAWRFLGLLALATVPAALAGVLLKDLFERAFDSLTLVGVNFLATGTMLWSARFALARAAAPHPSATGAGAIGLAQALAILPGISRSGSTIAAGLWMGVAPVRAAEFSFLMSIPVIAGAAVLEVPHLAGSLPPGGAAPLALGFAVAMGSGVFAIRLLLALLARGVFHRFALYCWAIGLVTVGWGLARA